MVCLGNTFWTVQGNTRHSAQDVCELSREVDDDDGGCIATARVGDEGWSMATAPAWCQVIFGHRKQTTSYSPSRKRAAKRTRRVIVVRRSAQGQLVTSVQPEQLLLMHLQTRSSAFEPLRSDTMLAASTRCQYYDTCESTIFPTHSRRRCGFMHRFVCEMRYRGVGQFHTLVGREAKWKSYVRLEL